MTPIVCTDCRTPLGVMVGALLYVGAVVHDRPTPLRCLRCGKRRVWTPPAATALAP